MIAPALSFFCGAILAALFLCRAHCQALKKRDRKIEFLRWQLDLSKRLNRLERDVKEASEYRP